MLPQKFTDRMRQMLGEEYEEFAASYEREKYQALRLNEENVKLPFGLEPVPWANQGFYYGKECTPGKHPYHEAGVYYIQEPSAMAPVSYLMEEMSQPHEYEERILDLCAAPGGKSTQIAAAMKKAYREKKWQTPGILLCNEIHPARAKILSENIERMGVRNAIVTNETPQRLSGIFESYFTRILVDAPCSGEGMFRKNEEAGSEWSTENVQLCAKRQDEILDCAAGMLAYGGRLVYSTCTFAPAENEGSIARFLRRHPDFHIVKVKKAEGMSPGRPEWAYFGEEQGTEQTDLKDLADTIRLWPHLLRGEGHYLAVLQRDGEIHKRDNGYCKNGLEKGISETDLNVPQKGKLEYAAFAKEELKTELDGIYVKFGEQLYLAPVGMPSVKGLKVLRPGLHLGTIKKGRFEPSHALALTLSAGDVVHTWELSADSPEIRGYLNGLTFTCEGDKGWYLITVDGHSTGWGKLAGGVMKNHYPKGLRKMI